MTIQQKYPIVDEMTKPVTSNVVADKIKDYVSLFVRSDKIMTDSELQYSGETFQSFTKSDMTSTYLTMLEATVLLRDLCDKLSPR